MPIVFYVMVVALLRASFAMSHDESVNPRRVFRSYWTVSDDKGTSTIDDEATNQALA